MEEFRARLSGGKDSPLTDKEKQQLLDEMGDRLDRMGKLLEKEQGDQNSKLGDILALRRKKKGELTLIYNQVQSGADSKDKEFSDKLVQIAKEEAEEVAGIDREIAKERQQSLNQIEDELQKQKNMKLAEIEKKLEKLKKTG